MGTLSSECPPCCQDHLQRGGGGSTQPSHPHRPGRHQGHGPASLDQRGGGGALQPRLYPLLPTRGHPGIHTHHRRPFCKGPPFFRTSPVDRSPYIQYSHIGMPRLTGGWILDKVHAEQPVLPIHEILARIRMRIHTSD